MFSNWAVILVLTLLIGPGLADLLLDRDNEDQSYEEQLKKEDSEEASNVNERAIKKKAEAETASRRPKRKGKKAGKRPVKKPVKKPAKKPQPVKLTRHTTAEFTRSVRAITNENKTIRFTCHFFLVHDNKTVFLEEIKPALARRKNLPKPEFSTVRQNPTSQVSCTPNKISAKAVDFEIHSKSSDSSTMTTFTFTLTTNPDVIKSATVRVTERLRGQEISGQLGLSSKIEKLGNLTPDDKKRLNDTLNKSILTFISRENSALLMKSKKTFIQFNKKTDQLGQNARLFATIAAAANAFKGKTPEAELQSDIRELISLLSENCQNSTDGFEGTDPSNVTCNPCDKYRRLDGFCNNLNNKGFGAAGIPLRRLLPNAYDDGFSIPRGGFSSTLPSPRLISAKIHHHAIPINSGDTPLTTKGFTHMAMQFGQFLDHDITLSAQQELDCCDPVFSESDQTADPVLRRCFNIDIDDDNFYQSRNVSCHSFTRSDFICISSDDREQINGITAFIDASNVYGSDTIRASKLRVSPNLGEGKLKENTAQTPGHLPTRSQCGLSGPGTAADLVAGDVRANVQPALASIHTLFLNEHNRIAEALKDEANSRTTSFLTGLSPIKKDKILYEEARKIVGATIQNIVYEEYVPIILGSVEVAAQGLEIVASSTYDEHLDPSIINEFATVAYRFGHSLIAGKFNTWALRRHYFDNSGFVLSNLWKREMDLIIQQECPARDLPCTHDVTNFLFQNHNLMPTGTGDDLIARNIQRGRDHGIPSYRKLRKFCNLSDLAETPPLPPPEINETVWSDILMVYDSKVDDIDAFTGGLAEEAPADGLVGPTFACIIGQQFKRLMLGDRFFFTHTSGSDHVRGLQPKSKATVRKRTLGDIICDNAVGTGGIQTTPSLHVMLEDSVSNGAPKCVDREPLDISGIVDDIETFNPCSTTTTKSTTETTRTTTESTTETTRTTTKPTTETTRTTTESTTETTRTTTKSTTETTRITTESTTKTTIQASTSTTENFKPLPGYCATKSSDVVDYDEEWSDGCLDLKGNMFSQDQFLISCCSCFKIICNSSQASDYSRHIIDKVFFWNKTLEPQCCQDCNGKVFTEGSIMNIEVLGDNCSTTFNTKCVYIGQENKAIAQITYTHRNCCSDETGLHPIGTSIDVPKTCSKRTCYRDGGQKFSVWSSMQVLSGCNCCPLPTICSQPKITCSIQKGNLVEDGGVVIIDPGYPHKPRNLTCCEGKFLEEPPKID